MAILGVIATFTIPKFIVAQQNGTSYAAAKEAASMISAAYEVYASSNTITSGTTAGALTSYMNFIAVNSSGAIMDDIPGYNQVYSCSGTLVCLTLHSGGTLFYKNNVSFAGTATTNAIFFLFDPDSQRVGVTTDGPSKAIAFYLYSNGRLASAGNLTTGTFNSLGTNYSATDPSWFTW